MVTFFIFIIIKYINCIIILILMIKKDEKIEFLPKTADAKFRVKGKDLNEAFSLCAVAMFKVMYDTDKIRATKRKEINVSGKDKLSLLYNFLEELLFLFDTEFLLVNHVENLLIDKVGDVYHLHTIIIGEKKSKTHDISGGIKAITYNEMKIEEKKDFVVIEAVLDL